MSRSKVIAALREAADALSAASSPTGMKHPYFKDKPSDDHASVGDMVITTKKGVLGFGDSSGWEPLKRGVDEELLNPKVPLAKIAKNWDWSMTDNPAKYDRQTLQLLKEAREDLLRRMQEFDEDQDFMEASTLDISLGRLRNCMDELRQAVASLEKLQADPRRFAPQKDNAMTALKSARRAMDVVMKDMEKLQG